MAKGSEGVIVQVNEDEEMPTQQASESQANGLFTLLSCRRRASNTRPASKYECLVRDGRALSAAEQDTFGSMAWWSESPAKSGEKVFIVVPYAPAADEPGGVVGPAEDVNMWKLLAYVLSQMHDHVVQENQPYSVIWIQLNDHRVSSWSAWSFKRSLHQRYSENLRTFHVVHPSWSIRLLRLFLWPISSEEFWDHFVSHERIEFLDTFVDVESLGLPRDICEYDTFLDAEAKHTMETGLVQGMH
jgi:hypothetical protein